MRLLRQCRTPLGLGFDETVLLFVECCQLVPRPVAVQARRRAVDLSTFPALEHLHESSLGAGKVPSVSTPWEYEWSSSRCYALGVSDALLDYNVWYQDLARDCEPWKLPVFPTAWNGDRSLVSCRL
jgi:hypothetical protein